MYTFIYIIAYVYCINYLNVDSNHIQTGSNVLHISSSIGSLNTYNDSDGILGSTDAHYEKPSIFVPLLGCITLLLLYITCGAASIADTQNIEFRYEFIQEQDNDKEIQTAFLDYLKMNNFFFSDAFYFCFVALCTIGFGGDLVRLSSDTGIWLIVIYIFLGVTLLSTTLHIVHQVIISEISNISLPSL